MAVRAAARGPMKHSTAIIVLLACTLAATTAARAQKSVVTTIARTPAPAQILGAQHRESVEGALRATASGDLPRALDLLRPVIAFCDALLAEDRKLVSVANEAEYTAFVSASASGEPVDWVDMACPEAYDAHAFIDIERKDADAAFIALHKAIRLAPYWADPLAELGHLLNVTGKPAEGLARYRAALALVERQPGSGARHALVLRGMGYSQIELGDLDGAEQTYRKSLEVEPGNALAQRELEYISEQRKKKATKP